MIFNQPQRKARSSLRISYVRAAIYRPCGPLECQPGRCAAEVQISGHYLSSAISANRAAIDRQV